MNIDEITSQLKESLMLTIEIAFAIAALNIFMALSLFYRENDISTERFHLFRKSLKGSPLKIAFLHVNHVDIPSKIAYFYWLLANFVDCPGNLQNKSTS